MKCDIDQNQKIMHHSPERSTQYTLGLVDIFVFIFRHYIIQFRVP